MADGGAEPQDEDEHSGGQDPADPQSPASSPGHSRVLLLTEDIAARKRPRLCRGTRASPSHPWGPENPWELGGARGVWGPRAGRVTGLYAQLLRELETEVEELQRALAARDEAVLHRDRRIRQLELENRQLRNQVRSLEEENDLLSSGGGRGGPLATAATATRTLLASGTGCIGVSDSNVQFLKGLVGLLESDSAMQENGRPKLELVPNSGVYITHPQLDDLSQVSTDKPKLMTRRLLDYFFSRETLARSSATGQRIAHNNTTMERPLRLPVAVVNAIKGRGRGWVGWGPLLVPSRPRRWVRKGHGATRERGRVPPPPRRVRHQDVRPRLQLQRRHQQQVRHVPAGRQEDGREDGVSRDPRDTHGPPAARRGMSPEPSGAADGERGQGGTCRGRWDRTLALYRGAGGFTLQRPAGSAPRPRGGRAHGHASCSLQQQGAGADRGKGRLEQGDAGAAHLTGR
uniref:Uncharacterized LOC115344644 n=1 Tax=Aquila chrysaetos chrysaetos TaxID=223781 RepID=A0A663E7C8_AQUCH